MCSWWSPPPRKLKSSCSLMPLHDSPDFSSHRPLNHPSLAPYTVLQANKTKSWTKFILPTHTLSASEYTVRLETWHPFIPHPHTLHGNVLCVSRVHFPRTLAFFRASGYLKRYMEMTIIAWIHSRSLSLEFISFQKCGELFIPCRALNREVDG